MRDAGRKTVWIEGDVGHVRWSWRRRVVRWRRDRAGYTRVADIVRVQGDGVWAGLVVLDRRGWCMDLIEL